MPQNKRLIAGVCQDVPARHGGDDAESDDGGGDGGGDEDREHDPGPGLLRAVLLPAILQAAHVRLSRDPLLRDPGLRLPSRNVSQHQARILRQTARTRSKSKPLMFDAFL